MLRPLVAALAVALMSVAACSGDGDDDDTGTRPAETTLGGTGGNRAAAFSLPEDAQSLRMALNDALVRHVLLTAAAAGAGLDERDDELTATQGALEANRADLAAVFEAVFGPEAGDRFAPLWARDADLFAEYTAALAAGDQAAADQAVAALGAFADDFGVFVNGLLPALAPDIMAGLVDEHVLTLKAVIDARADNDHPTAYRALNTAGTHMDLIAEPLAGAVATAFPERVTGDAAAPTATVAAQLSTLLGAHTFLLGDGAGAAIGGRADQLEALRAALIDNTNTIAAVLLGTAGQSVAQAFFFHWEKHGQRVVDYAVAVAEGDGSTALDPVAALDSDDPSFRGFITLNFGRAMTGVLTSVPADRWVEAAQAIAEPLKALVENQAIGRYAAVATNLTSAAERSSALAALMVGAIAKQFPDKYPA